MSIAMITKAAEQRRLYRRLREAGCRLDYDNLPRTPMPLRVISLPWQWPTHVFPMGPAIAVVVPIRIVALQARTIRKCSVSGNWSPGHLLPRCPKVERAACLKGNKGTHYHLKMERAFNQSLLGSELKRGTYREGFLAVIFPRPVSSSVRTNLEITLAITDEFGDEYPFDLSLTHDPAGEAETSAALVTTYRA